MHTLLKVTMSDTNAANKAINEGRLEEIFQKAAKLTSAETSFFYAENGYRTAIFIFDMKDSSMIPQIAEPFFNELNAKVEFFPTMDTKEMTQGVSAWRQQQKNEKSLS